MKKPGFFQKVRFFQIKGEKKVTFPIKGRITSESRNHVHVSNMYPDRVTFDSHVVNFFLLTLSVVYSLFCWLTQKFPSGPQTLSPKKHPAYSLPFLGGNG